MGPKFMNWFDRDDFIEGVSFSIPVTDEMIGWWQEKFGEHQMLPRDLCSFLTQGLQFDQSFEIYAVDISAAAVKLEIKAFDSAGEVFFTGRSIEFIEKQVHLNSTGVREDAQERGIGRTLARNCYRLARELDFERLGVTALDGGAYTWTRAGFLPTFQNWNEGKCKPGILKKMGQLTELDWETRNAIYRMMGSSEPRTIWDIADLRDEVASIREPRMKIPLGRSLLGESEASWIGEIDFTLPDEELSALQIRRAEDYLRIKRG